MLARDRTQSQLLALALTSSLGARDGSALEVLYVGPDPDADPTVPSYVTGDDATRMIELVKERTPAFKAFLEQHFETVEDDG